MFFRYAYLFFKHLRPVVFGFAVAGLFCVCMSGTPAHAQRAGGDKPGPRAMERIDQEEGARRLAAFREQRLDGDYFFQFQLQHKPNRSSRTIRYQGVMWGSWNEIGPVTRLKVSPVQISGVVSVAVPELVELILQNGVSPQAWIRYSDTSEFVLLEGDALFEPILPGLLYSAFDLQMPFVYWEDFVYEGPTLVGVSRVAQQFVMQPPVGSASAARGIQGVRLELDDTYDALLRIEVLGAQGELSSRFAVESFQKVQEQYIVKSITLTDYPSKDSTTFKVQAAAVGISLGEELFRPSLSLSTRDYVPDSLQGL
jgi:hypothetical protein